MTAFFAERKAYYSSISIFLLCLIPRPAGWILASGFSSPIFCEGGATGFRIESNTGRSTLFLRLPAIDQEPMGIIIISISVDNCILYSQYISARKKLSAGESISDFFNASAS